MKKHLFFFFFLSSLFWNSQKPFFPVIAFQGVPEAYNDEFHFKNLLDAGFNVNLNMYSDMQSAVRALELGQKMNVKIIVSVPELKTNPESAIKILKNYPALLGYYIEDEPSLLRFDELSVIVKKILILDPKHSAYINLFPNYAEKELLKAKNYKDYIDQYLLKVNPTMLSFDHYSVVNNTIRPEYYDNLEIVRSEAKKFKTPFWAFACSVIHFNYKQPTYPSIRMQQFSNLLYGAQGLQYYTYWSVNDADWKKNNYSYAIVDDRGNPTPTYNVVKTVNQQIQRLAWVFTGAKSDEIYHTGNEIPQGTKKLNSTPTGFRFFSTYGKNALVSLMSNGKKRFIIIQNTSLDENLDFKYQLQFPMKKVSNSTGKLLAISTQKKYSDTILPGDILIFTYDQ